MTQQILSITRGPRKSNIEILRIVAMIMVLVFHADFLIQGSPTYTDFVDDTSNAFTRTFIESLSAVCVNVFVLISGWFGIKATFKGFFSFIFQCAYFLIGIYAILLLTGYTELSMKGIAGSLCLLDKNWFLRAYVALYLLSPMLNIFIRTMSKKKLKIFLIGFYTFQTIWGWSGAANFMAYGYSCFSFVGLYVLSAYIKRYTTANCIIGGGFYLASVILNTILYYAVTRIGIGLNVYAYLNPLIVAGAIGILLWFNGLKVKPNNMINSMAKSSFAAYLFHANPNIFPFLYAPIMQHLYSNHDGIVCLLLMLLAVFSFYAFGTILDIPRRVIWDWLSQRIPWESITERTLH